MRHLAIGLALLGAGCLDLGDDTADGGSEDAYCGAGDVRIPAGTQLSCSDGCNYCDCEEQDVIGSTLMGCFDSGAPEAGCVAGMFLVDYGTSWTAADGSGSCTCQEDGSFSCGSR